MVAFRAPDGRRVDFITINDPGAPTDTPEEFVALLKATADAAAGSQGAGLVNLLASQARLLAGLVAPRGPSRAGHRRAGDPPDRAHLPIEHGLPAVLDRRRPRAGRARQVHLRARGRRERTPAGRGGRPLPDRGLDAPARRGSPRVRPLLDSVPGRSRDAPRGPDARLEGRPPVTRGYGHVRGSRSRGQGDEAGGAPGGGDGSQSGQLDRRRSRRAAGPAGHAIHCGENARLPGQPAGGGRPCPRRSMRRSSSTASSSRRWRPSS